jgi:hypothetical protein
MRQGRSLKLGSRSLSVRNEQNVFFRRMPCVSLGEIRRDRNGRAPHLGSQAKSLVARKLAREGVDVLDKINTLPPDDQFLKSSTRHRLSRSVPAFLPRSCLISLFPTRMLDPSSGIGPSLPSRRTSLPRSQAPRAKVPSWSRPSRGIPRSRSSRRSCGASSR